MYRCVYKRNQVPLCSLSKPENSKDSLDPSCTPEKYRPYLLHPLRRVQIADESQDTIGRTAKVCKYEEDIRPTKIQHESLLKGSKKALKRVEVELEQEREKSSALRKQLQEVSEELETARVNLKTSTMAYNRAKKELAEVKARDDVNRKALWQIREQLSRSLAEAAKDVAVLQQQMKNQKFNPSAHRHGKDSESAGVEVQGQAREENVKGKMPKGDITFKDMVSRTAGATSDPMEKQDKLVRVERTQCIDGGNPSANCDPVRAGNLGDFHVNDCSFGGKVNELMSLDTPISTPAYAIQHPLGGTNVPRHDSKTETTMSEPGIIPTSPVRNDTLAKALLHPRVPVASDIRECNGGGEHYWNRRGSNTYQRRYVCKSCGFFVREKVVMGIWQRV